MLYRSLFLFFFSFASLHAISDAKWEEFKETALKKHHRIPGWCKREKAEKLMDFIRDKRPKTCVEIGVYGGSSAFPISKALKKTKCGILYAVDPWSKDEALKFETEEANIDTWGNLDYEKVFTKFNKLLKKHKLTKVCKVRRLTAEEAYAQFEDESIDFIHVDGNHNEESCMYDVKKSLQKLKKGGYLLFDDANWHQTRKAVAYLKENCQFEEKYSVADECLLFKKL